MAKLSQVVREKKREKLIELKREKRQQLKKIIQDPRRSEEEHRAAQLSLNKMPRNSSKIRLRNRCQLTGRSRGFLRKFKLSRLCFREMANKGLIPGVYKASW
ncbi:MAG: 30S ribosomal protein S14 [Anaplasmataceae bacterium]|nr:30S ribosomal protein S14 [Anaplasmataceae bacterium]